MKKCWVVIMLTCLLTGCGVQETFETISDIHYEQQPQRAQQVVLELPQDAAVPVIENSQTGSIYLCDGYTVAVQTMEAGDLNRTLQDCTGFSKEKLSLIETNRDGLRRYECVWTAAGEGTDQVGRAVVLDDGSYHYVITVMADADRAGQLQPDLQGLFDSIRLTNTD